MTILDGEICCLNPDGSSNFYDLRFRREWPFFLAFDLLAVEVENLRPLPLLARKRRLRRIMPSPRIESRLRFMDHIDCCRAGADQRGSKGAVGEAETGEEIGPVVK